jgi:uncharacterized Zn finger protein (UPF0148 family)
MREMDMRIQDKDGRTICPNCGKAYFPELGERKEPGKPWRWLRRYRTD